MGDEMIQLPGVLSREQIAERIAAAKPLLRDFQDLGSQLQPNGFDLTVAELNAIEGPCAIGLSNADRLLPDLVPVSVDESGWWHLRPGIYQIVYTEIVALPNDLMALARPRSSLNRSGITIHTAVWDAGYEGRSTSLLNVLNPAGFRLQRGARVAQMVFFGMAKSADEGYRGAYQGENIAR